MNSLSLVEFGAANDLISSPVLSLPLFKIWYLNLSHSIVHVIFVFSLCLEFKLANSCMKTVLFSAHSLQTNEVFG